MTGKQPTHTNREIAKNTSILLIDNHHIILELVSQSLESTGAFSVKCAASIEVAHQEISNNDGFDIVMLEVALPDTVGLQDVKTLVDLNKNGQVIIFSGAVSEIFIQNCLDIGISGFIPKTFTVDALTSALKLLSTGHKFVPMNFFTFHGSLIGKESYGLGDGDFEVLKKLAEGLSNRDIMNILSLPETTIKMRVRSICQKLGAKNRTQAVLIAQKSGMI